MTNSQRSKKRKEPNLAEQYKNTLTQVKRLLYHSKFEEALQVLEPFEQEKLIDPNNRVLYYLLKSILFTKLGHFSEALIFADQAYRENMSLEQPLQQIDILIAKAEVLWRTGEFDEGQKLIAQGEDIFKLFTNRSSVEVGLREALLLYHKGTIYRLKGNLDHALEYHQRALSIQEKFGLKKEIAASLTCLGFIYDLKGDLDHALHYHQQSLALKEELGDKQGIGASLNNIGIVYMLKGELNQALRYYEQSLRLFEEIGNKQDIAMSLTNIGIIYRQQGDLTRALVYHQRSLLLTEEIGNKQEITRVLTNIGLVYHQKGELERALNYFERSLAIHENIGHNIDTALTLFRLVITNLDTNSPQKAQRYLQRLQEINKLETNKLISQRSRIAEALLLKTSKTSQNLEKVSELLNQVVKEEIINQDLTTLALINLCDLLIAKLKIFNSLKLQKEIKNHIDRLFTISQHQGSHWLIAGTYILKAKLTFTELRHSHTIDKEKQLERYLKLAQQFAQEKRLLVLLGQGEILISLSFLIFNQFDKAEQALQKAQEIIGSIDRPLEKQKLEELRQTIQASKESYLEMLQFTFGEQEQVQKQTIAEQQFILALDSYLQAVKKLFSDLD